MIQQPNLMTPQVPAQQPTQIVFVPANLGTTQPASTAPATSSNDSAMKFMLMMMTMLLGSLNKKEAADKDDIEEENIETTDPKKTDSQSKTDNLDGKEVDGTIYYTASNLNKTVSDKAGKTKTQIGGSNNKINFKGDDGENTFIVGGKNNNTTIEDIGGDDKIVLEGNKYDWKVVSTEDVDKSGKNVEIFWVKHSVQGKVKVVLKNEKTGSTVTLITKKGDLNEMRTRIATCTSLTER